MGLRTSALWLASLGLQRWRRAPAQVADGRLSQPQRRLRWRSLGTQVPAVRSQRGRRSVRRALRMDATCPVHVASLYGDSEADIDVWRVLREPLGTFRPGLRARGWRPAGPWTHRHSSMAFHRTGDAGQAVAAHTRRWRTAIRLAVRGSLRSTATVRPLTPGWPKFCTDSPGRTTIGGWSRS